MVKPTTTVASAATENKTKFSSSSSSSSCLVFKTVGISPPLIFKAVGTWPPNQTEMTSLVTEQQQNGERKTPREFILNVNERQANHLRNIIKLKTQYIQSQKKLKVLQGLFKDKEKLCRMVVHFFPEIQVSERYKKIPTPPPTPPPPPSPRPPPPPPPPVWRPW